MTRRNSSPFWSSPAEKKSAPKAARKKARKPARGPTAGSQTETEKGNAAKPPLNAAKARPAMRPVEVPREPAPRLPRPLSSFAAGAWPRAAPLFPPLSVEAREALARLPEALARVRPLSAAHRRSLPEDVAALSRLLTTERGALGRPYWSSPAFVSAYLYYFLPWNLLRLTRLLAALPLPDPYAAISAGGEALLLDAGSGPLTLPLALWLARPEWREAPVRVLALDSAAQPLELGRDLFAAWGEILGQKTWPVRTARGPLESLARHAAPLLSGGRGTERQRGAARPWLIGAANVLNELPSGRRSGGREEEEPDAEQDDLSGSPRNERLERLLDALAPLLFRGDAAQGEAQRIPSAPSLLFVEPGTRLGGNTIMRLRALALEGGLKVLAPCTHDAACPLLTGSGGRTWCHFTFDSLGAPDWLSRLSGDAGLAKSGLSLAPLLLAPAAGPEHVSEAPGAAAHELPGFVAPFARDIAETGGAPVRVLSAPFAVPGLAGRARYACAATGLLLLEDAESLASGDLLPVGVAADAPRDAKSRALVARRPPAKRR